MTTKELAGLVMGALAMTAAIIFYDWKLALIIVLAIFGNNLERSGRSQR